MKNNKDKMKSILPENIKLWIQEGPANLHFIWYPAYAATIEMNKQHDFGFNFLLIKVKDNMFIWAPDENDLMRIGRLVAQNEAKDKNYTKKLICEWEKRVKKYYDLCKQIDNTKLGKLSDRELAELFKQFTKLYIEEYAVPILADAMGYFCEIELQILLKKHLQKINKEKEFNRYLTNLTQPVEDSFISEEKHEVLHMVKDYLKGRDFSKKLQEHAKRWFWIQNNYLRAVVLDENYFMERIKEHAKNPVVVKEKLKNFKEQFQKARKEKEDLIEELKLGEEIRLVLKLLDEYSSWQDVRKKANVIAQHYLALFLKEASRRKKIPLADLEYTIRDEIIDLLLGKEINMKEIKQRKKITCLIFTPKMTLYNYDDSLILDKEVQAYYKTNGANEIYGTVANMGKITGKVRIIMNPSKFVKLHDGEILVTSMTRPEFLPIMKKAAAIITDEGGITCHAAIVSRELGIPCVIGTKIATKILKDGDLVEVNANHGVVRKVNR